MRPWLLLALYGGERHGYALMDDVEKLTEGAVALGPATLYRSLQRMRVGGLVTEVAADNSDARGDRRAERRRSYRIRPRGRRAVSAEARRLAQLVGTATELGVIDRED